MREHFAEVMEAVFNLPCRRGTPMGLNGIVDDFRSPSFAVAAGLALYSFRNRLRTTQAVRNGKFSSMGNRIRTWFAEML